MHNVSVSRTIGFPADRVWEVLDDFGAVYRYHPLVERSPLRNGVGSGEGAERTCHFVGGDRIVERITDYDPGRSYTVAIIDTGKFPVKSAVVRFSVGALDSPSTRVGIEMAFQPKFGAVGWLLGVTVMRRQFRKVLAGILAGLETHLRTGRTVGAGQEAA
jgi:hypothetical protein